MSKSNELTELSEFTHFEQSTSNPVDSVVPGGVTTLFIIFAITVTAGLFWLIERHETAEREKSLLRTASESASTMSKIRSFYSQEVVSRLSDSNVQITHNYKDLSNAIPLPATLSIELGDYLEKTGDETSFRLLSDRPFPTRANRKIDPFEQDAITQLRIEASEPYFRYEDIDGQAHMRFAQAVIMEASCVACHNSHPESPFTNWQVGDVRGIQEVILPVNYKWLSSPDASSTFRDIVVFVGVAFTLALLSLLSLARRNRKAFTDLEQLAELEHLRVHEIRHSKGQVDEALARLRAVVDTVAEAIITIGENGIIQSANSATEAIFGYPIEELIGKNVSMLMPESDAKNHNSYIQRYCETGDAHIIGIGREVTGLHRDGHEIPVELSIGEVNLDGRRLFTGVVRDVSERKEAEQALRESEEQTRKLSLVAAKTDNAVIITDSIGRIEWVNEGFTRISGYEANEAIGKTPAELLQRKDVNEPTVTRIREAMRTGQPFSEELLNYHKSGRPYWISIDAQPIYDDNGEVQQYIAIERDVTDRRQREQALRTATVQAREASEAKSRFLAMMSHEVRTPLNGVIGGLGLLQDTALDDEQRTYADTSRNSAESLLAIINDILDFSKMEAGKLDLEMASFEVLGLVDSVTELFKQSCEDKGLELDSNIEPGIPSCLKGDAARTRQILVNLVSNALKFTDHGGIKITVSDAGRTEQAIRLRFEVVDTGIGIDSKQYANLFEEFWSANETGRSGFEGTGLGLAICRRLVDIMDGEIGLQSTPGEGSTFWFEIPFDIEAEIFEGERISDTRDEIEHFEGRVLLAEDNPTNQMIAQLMLTKLGLTVDVVADGLEAVEALRIRSYDLVLMDIAMPEMDGITATRKIREMQGRHMHTPIIALTAHAMQGDRENILAEGLDDYLVKPINQSTLQSCLARWLKK